jgi:DNA-directed RNA polymerase specialized sigma24 family protein
MAALMPAVQRGERAAYAALLHSIAHTAHQHAISHSATASQASAYVQSVLTTVHKALPTYDPGRAFWPWLNAILRAHAATLPKTRKGARLRWPLVLVPLVRGRPAHQHRAASASTAP